MTDLARQRIEELLAHAITASPEALRAMVAEISRELGTRAEFDRAREWHAQMLRLRGAVVAIGNARYGFAWASEKEAALGG